MFNYTIWRVFYQVVAERLQVAAPRVRPGVRVPAGVLQRAVVGLAGVRLLGVVVAAGVAIPRLDSITLD